MDTSTPRLNRFLMQGQALVEFLIAVGVLMALCLAVYHLGVLVVVRQTTLQASRYAAHQTHVQPLDRIESDLHERFFTPGFKPLHVWGDGYGQPFPKDSHAVSVSMQSQPLEGLGSAAVQVVAGTYGLPRRDLQRVEVQVDVPNPLGGPGSVLAVKAHTTVLADPWSAEGSEGVQRALDASALGAAMGRALRTVGPAVSWGVGLLEEHAPVMPCINVEAVPPHRLSEGSVSSAGGCR